MLQVRLEHLLRAGARSSDLIVIEHPYRPALDLQFWIADVALVPRAIWDSLPDDEYPIYAPPLIVEVLSPSNTAAKLNRQRLVAMSAGTREFWVVDPVTKTVHVTGIDRAQSFAQGEHIESIAGSISVDDVFRFA